MSIIQNGDNNLEQTSNFEVYGKTVSQGPLTAKPFSRPDTKKTDITIPITVHWVDNKQWKTKTFDSQELVLIGSSPAVSKVVMRKPEIDEGHIALRFLYDRWAILDRGVNNITLFNGIGCRETMLTENSIAHVRLAGAPIIISTGKKEESETAGMVSGKKFNINLSTGTRTFDFVDSVVLGSSEHATVQLEEGKKFAAIISAYKGQLYINSITGKDIVCDAVPVEGKALPLKNGSFIKMSDTTFEVEIPDEISEPVPAPEYGELPMAIMRIKRDNTLGQMIKVPNAGQAVSIGRTDDNWLAFETSQVSRSHAQLLLYENSMTVIDQNSTNGTFVNGERITKKLAKIGDIVAFANKEFLLKYLV